MLTKVSPRVRAPFLGPSLLTPPPAPAFMDMSSRCSGCHQQRVSFRHARSDDGRSLARTERGAQTNRDCSDARVTHCDVDSSHTKDQAGRLLSIRTAAQSGDEGPRTLKISVDHGQHGPRESEVKENEKKSFGNIFNLQPVIYSATLKWGMQRPMDRWLCCLTVALVRCALPGRPPGPLCQCALMRRFTLICMHT